MKKAEKKIGTAGWPVPRGQTVEERIGEDEDADKEDNVVHQPCHRVITLGEAVAP
jgi:hypothetical protein